MLGKFFLFFVFIITFTARAQWLWDYGVSFGVSNYLGDIGGKEKTRQNFVADMKMAKTRWNIGTFGRYKLLPKISVKLAFEYLRIEGDDKLSSNPARNARNLNFRNDMLDAGLMLQYFFFEDNDLGNTYQYKEGLRTYLFAGVGCFYSNPKAYYKNNWVPLRNLHTEGVKYNPIGITIPMGIGLYYTRKHIHRFGFEINYRKTFTDYLDDISGNYPENPNQSQNPNLSLRTPELYEHATMKDLAVYKSHNWGEKRGDKTHNDSYITINVSYSRVLLGRISFYKSPINSFFGGKKKNVKVRKIRATF